MTTTYGSDLSCVTDIDPAGQIVTELVALGQSLARRLITPTGSLLEDPLYGYDLTDLIFDDLSPADIARVGARVDAEFRKDDRVLTSKSTIVLLEGVLMVSSVVKTATTTATLVIAVTDVTATLLQVIS